MGLDRRHWLKGALATVTVTPSAVAFWWLVLSATFFQKCREGQLCRLPSLSRSLKCFCSATATSLPTVCMSTTGRRAATLAAARFSGANSRMVVVV